MERRDRGDRVGTERIVISRRAALGSSGLAVLGLLACSAAGQDQNRQDHDAAIEARLEQRKAFSERIRNAGSMEERIRMMEEIREKERQRAIDAFKRKLQLSDQDWTVLKPRIEDVYNMVYPLPAPRSGADRKGTELDQHRSELREVLDNSASDTGQIKATLTALRAAKDKADRELTKARQDLRRLMTVRQEAELVLCGLLD